MSPKHERIDKELLLLRNLPNQYKLGQKKTALGRVIYVSQPNKSYDRQPYLACLFPYNSFMPLLVLIAILTLTFLLSA